MPKVTTAISNANSIEEAAIPAELLAVITAVAAVFVGKRMRIRGIVQMHSPRQTVSRWSRQGRVLVQSSHNLPVKHLASTI